MDRRRRRPAVPGVPEPDRQRPQVLPGGLPDLPGADRSRRAGRGGAPQHIAGGAARRGGFTERFVRGDESRTDGGSGLGLSIARTFTEACGGTFSVQTQADLFTASVSFPLTRERPPKEESAV
ncbi:MAG: ATP-binding protein [Flavonifractor plautii]